MRAIEIQNGFGLQNLALVERPEPRPDCGSVLVRIKAASLNYRDLMMAKGLYNPKQPLPLIPVSDGAGEVIEVGEGVSRFRVGDRVACNVVQRWISGEPSLPTLRGSTLGGPLDGVLTEEMVVPEKGLVRIPEHLSFEEAATLPCAGLTAWNALITGSLKPGNSLVVQGTGGVSIFALQFGLLMGARVIVTSSSDEKLQRALALGAHEGINYRTSPDWEKRVKELTGGAGADQIIEVGGALTLPQSMRAVRPGGQISLIGVLAGSGEVNPVPIFMLNLRVHGIFVGHREMFEDMNRAIGLHRLHPVVDSVFQFPEARPAFELMERGGHFGKIVIRI